MQDKLADKRQVIVILRLTLDGHGHFMHGEAVDLAGQRIGGFVDWQNMAHIIQAWLATQEDDDTFNALP
jgi:hypothetical protein